MTFNLTNAMSATRLRLAPLLLLSAAVLAPTVHAQTASNTATVTAPTGIVDPNTANNSATDTDTVVAPLLTLAKTHSGNFSVGVNGVYTLTVSNSGTSPTTGTVTIVDTLPAGLSFVSGTGTGWTCSAAGQVVTCTSTTAIAAGAAGNPIALTVAVAAAASPSVTNTARASGGGDATCPVSGANQARCNASDLTTVNAPARLLLVKVAPATVTAGGSLPYTLLLTNVGSSPTSPPVIVQDQLPAGVIVTTVLGGADCGPLPSAPGALLTCIVSTPIASNGATLVINLLAIAPGVAGPITNYAATNPNAAGNPGTPPGPACVDNATTDCASATTTVVAPQLSLAKTHTGNFSVGVNGVYTLTVSNSGTSPTTGTVTIVDTLPTGLSFVSGTGAGWTCDAVAQVVTCTSTTAIANGASGNPITLTVGVAAAALPSVTNSARASGGGDAACPVSGASEARCIASDPTAVNAAADIRITKTNGTDAYVPGNTTVYTVVVSNQGPSAAANVTVVDNAPAGATITGWSCTGTSCPAASGSGNVNQVIATLANGASVSYAITVAYPSGFTDPVTNTATANSATTPDPTPGNNSASDTDPASPMSDLAITKSQATPNPARPGQPVTWTIVATNNGPSDAQMSVVDVVPASVTGLTLGGANAASCTITGQNVVCDFGIRPGNDVRTFTISGALSLTATGTLTNTASIGASGIDLVPGNNTATSTTPILPTIDAVDDGPTTIPSTGGATPTVIGNDTVNGQPATLGAGGNATLIPGTSPNAGLAMSATTGVITVAPRTAPGTYQYPYQICVNPATTPAACDTAIATVIVAATIDAVNDPTFTVPSTGGTTTTPVTANDTVNGQPATLGLGGNATFLSVGGPVGITLDETTGQVTVAPNTPPGVYSLSYTLCTNPPTTPPTCDTAVIQIIVTATINAVDDDFSATPVNGASGGATATVIINDTVNGLPATLGAGGNAILTPGTSPNAGLTMSAATGVITVAPGTPAGTYQYPYTICTNPATTPATCDTATATVVVAAAAIVANNDSFGPINGATGGSTATVLTNDTLNGQPVTVGAGGNVALTPGVSPNPGLVMNPDGTITIAPGTAAGSYAYPYTICEVINPTNCATAIATVVVGAATIDAVDDSFTATPVNGATGGNTPTVIANDTLNGQPVTVGAGGNSTLIPGTSPNAGLTMNPDGTITIAPGTAAGSYSYPYQICEVLNPTNCDTAIATVVVASAVIVATPDTLGPINGAAGGSTPTVVGNDTLNGQPVTVGPGGNTVLTPGTSPVPGIVMNPDGTITVAPGTPAGSYDHPYTICEVLNPTNCATTIATVTVAAPVIDAVDDNFAGTPVNGAMGGTTATVLGNDTLNGQPVTVGAGGNSTLIPGTSPTPGLTMNPDGTITIAPGTPAGTYQYPYQICEVLNPTNCDTATATVVVAAAAIDAVDDNFTATPVNGAAGGTTATVLGNDRLNGQPVTVGAGGNSTLIPGTSTNPGLTMNPDGTITVAPGTAAGSYTYTYQICEVLNPTNCDTATATVVVAAAAIDAVDDNFAGTPVNGAMGGTTATVLGNDTLNGQPVTVGAGGNSTLIPGASTNPGLTMNPDGTITIAPGTPAGTYQYPYQICEMLNPTNCDTATATVVVAAAVIVAIPDSLGPINGATGGSTPTVIVNDTLNGQPVTLGPGGNSTLAPGTSPAPGLVMNPDGTVTVAPGTPAGSYDYPYTICEVLNPLNCATTIATVTVAASAIVATDDAFGPINGGTGGSTQTVLGNDTLNGQPVTVGAGGNSTLTPGNSPVPGIVMNPDGTITVAPGTPAGSYDYPYTICEVLNPTNCATAIATVVVGAGTITAVNDTLGPVDGGAGGSTPTVVGNDTLNGQPITLGNGGNSTLTPGASPNPGIVMNPDGTITVAPGTPAGSYDYPYTICEVLNPTNCATAIATVVVGAGTITAVNDASPPISGGTGGSTPSVLGNDTLNGQPVTVGPSGNSALTPGTSPSPGIVMNPDGTITVAPGTPAGSYDYPYTICEVLNPTNCATAIATVVVGAGTIVANNDASPPINSGAGGTTPPVTGNDTLDGQPITLGTGGNATLTPGTSPNPGIVMNPDGTVTVAPGTPAGSYDYPYTICEALNPTNCATAIATVVVVAGAMVATDDAPPPIPGGTGGTTPPVIGNDTLDGQPVTLGPGGTVTLTPGPSPAPGIDINPDGTVSVAPGTPAGSYELPYTICEVINPANCATGTVTVVVVAPVIVATPDPQEPIDGNRGGTTPPVTGNDTLGGQPVTVGPGGNTTLTPGASPNPGLTMNPDGTITIAPGTPAGTYVYPYTICEVLNPANCATTSATLTVTAEPVTIRVIKTAGPRDVKIGDLVRYTVSLQNIGTSALVDGTLIDTPPAGFTYVNGSLDVADRDAAGRLVGTAPIRVDQLDVEAGGRATITYLLRVGAGVRPGIHTNSALVQDDGATVSNVGTAEVQLVSDPALDESLILGTVFDDRDSDGWQDAGDLGGLRVQGGFAPGSYVAGSTTVDRGNGPSPEADASAPMLHGLALGTLAARQSDADSAAAHAVVISQVLTSPAFTDDFALTSRQGVTVRMDVAGNTRVERSADAAKGLTSADPTVTRRVSQVANGYRVDYVVANNGVDERGIPGVRIASVEGLLVETDQFGRYHLVGIDGGSQERGRNFILKVDPATLPPGTVFTTDNPLVRRVTPGLPVRFDFGAKLPPGLVQGGTLAIELELGAVMFDADSAVIREAYAPVIDTMASRVRGHVGAAEVVIAADGDTQALAYDRAKAVQSALLAKLSPEDAAGLQVSLRADVDDPASTSVSLGRTPVLGTVLFDTDSAVIRPQFASLIDKLAADIAATKGGVVGVVGHADKRGSDAYNVALGLRRAKAVYEAIAARLDPQGRSALRVEISDSPTAPVGIRGQ